MDWWLFTHAEDPVPPPEIAKQQDFGRHGEKAVRKAWVKEQLKRRGHPETGDQPHTTPASTMSGTPVLRPAIW